jgi:cellulose biosynthesis protein BcsQ
MPIKTCALQNRSRLKGVKYLGKLSLVLADADQDYIGSLSNYIMKHHAQSFDIHTFTCAESLSAFFSGAAKRANIIISGPGPMEAVIPAGSADVRICLGDGKACRGGEGTEVINRYQHAEKLIAEVFGIYADKNTTGGLPAGPGDTRIAAFVSPSGGAGKSVISAGCSLLCSRRGLKAFYLNLEDIPSTGLYFRGHSDQNFSNVLYYLKDRDRNPGLRLTGASCTDISNGVRFFLPPESPLEMSSLLPGEVKTLLEGFRLAAAYDAVFVDMPGRLDECGIAVLNASDSVVCVCGSDRASRLKCRSFHAELELLEKRHVPGLTDKTVYVVNDSRGLGTGGVLDPAGRKPAAVFERFEAPGCAADEVDLPDCGMNFTSGINMLLESINPGWALRKYGKEGRDVFEG